VIATLKTINHTSELRFEAYLIMYAKGGMARIKMDVNQLIWSQ